MNAPILAAPAQGDVPGTAAVSMRAAGLAYGDRTLWSDLELDVAPGEFLVVLGPNGSGKTSLLRVLLGLEHLSSGTAHVSGAVGYVPQQHAVHDAAAVRGRDLVGLGLDGHRWGLGLAGRSRRRSRVATALAEVGAEGYADRPLGTLSGGEQQRLRVAQALVGDPAVLLCDEPLLSLDLAHQRGIAGLIDERRRSADTAVVFVTHEINPVLPMADRVLYLVDGRYRVGPVSEVMNSETLSELYGAPVDVLRVRDRLVVVGAESGHDHHVTES